MDDQFYTENPYGSTRFGTEEDARALATGYGPVGVLGDTVIRFPEQEPTIVFGGAGCGKFSVLGGYQLAHPSTGSFIVLDPGGQFFSTSWHWNLAAGRKAYAINPFEIGAYPDINHPVDLWSYLKDDKFLFDNAEETAEAAIPESAKKTDNDWVEVDARRWFSTTLIEQVLLEGRVTPASVWEMINQVDASDEALSMWCRAAEGLPYDVYSNMIEIYNRKIGSPKEYGAIMSHIKSSLRLLTSPQVSASISGDTDFFQLLADPEEAVGIYIGIPSGKGKKMRSFVRMLFRAAITHCTTAGLGARPLFYIEEAAILGAADYVKQLFSELRKFARTVAVYQSQGQPKGLFGAAGAQEIIDSAGMQIYPGGGIRSIESARNVADTVGQATISLNDPMAQAERAYNSMKAQLDVVYEGADPLQAALEEQHEKAQSTQQRKVGRYAIDPAEVMKLSDKVLVLSPGTGPPPVVADKLPPYYLNRAMNGRWGPDPLFPPLDRVKLTGRFFDRKRRFITEDVPEHLSHWPQHNNGQISYVEGYKTWKEPKSRKSKGGDK